MSFPVEENIDDQKLTFDEESELFHSEINDLTGEEIFLGFDIVRLDPSGSVIIAGKTQPNITVDIFDGNQKLSSVISDSHGDWVWVSEEKIKDGLKRFHLQHLDASGKITHSNENVIVFFESNAKENQKVVKITNNEKIGIEILNKKEIMGLALDSVEHFGESELRIKGRSVPNSEIKLVLSGKEIGKSIADVNGNWEFTLPNQI